MHAAVLPCCLFALASPKKHAGASILLHFEHLCHLVANAGCTLLPEQGISRCSRKFDHLMVTRLASIFRHSLGALAGSSRIRDARFYIPCSRFPEACNMSCSFALLGGSRVIRAVRVSARAALQFSSSLLQLYALVRVHPFVHCTTRLEWKTIPFQDTLCIISRDTRIVLVANTHSFVHALATGTNGED